MRPEQHRPGLVQHTLGWPLDNRTGGGSFLYHYGANLVSVGFVVHLNYANPYLSPYGEFQRFKTHPAIRGTFEGGKRIAYGARALTEGGWQSIPQLAFPGGVLVGCAAGLHERAAHQGLAQRHAVGHRRGRGRVRGDRRGPRARPARGLRGARACRAPSPRDLRRVRNAKPLLSKFGTVLGTVLLGRRHVAQHAPARHRPRLHAQARQAATTRRSQAAAKARADRLSQARRRAHLRPADQRVLLRHQPRGGPAGPPQGRRHGAAEALRARRLSPARRTAIARPASTSGWRRAGKPRYVINAQNCVHCKTCDIKDPNQNINWVVPEGGGGPNYPGM